MRVYVWWCDPLSDRRMYNLRWNSWNWDISELSPQPPHICSIDRTLQSTHSHRHTLIRLKKDTILYKFKTHFDICELKIPLIWLDETTTTTSRAIPLYTIQYNTNRDYNCGSHQLNRFASLLFQGFAQKNAYFTELITLKKTHTHFIHIYRHQTSHVDSLGRHRLRTSWAAAAAEGPKELRCPAHHYLQ